MSGDNESYGLENIILHHSFDQVKGRTIKVPCRERTHLGGVNGAGKTSVLALVPAFFGEEPERIVTKASGKLSFLDYYLPSFQSLIIFEYRRYSGLCCSVMFRHSQGKPCYRFVNGAASDTFFSPDIKELLQTGASADDVFAALRQNGMAVSRNIDTITNYRAIIQRNQKLLKRLPADARKLRGLSSDFGLGSPDTQMSHIDRLTHVVLNKHRLLSSFKTMICETQFENIHQHARPRAIDRKDLIADIRSLSAFANEESKIRSCLRKESERLAIAEQADKSVADLVATIDEANEKLAERTGNQHALENERGTLKETYLEADTEFARQANEQKAEFERLDAQLNELYKQNERYEANGVPAKVQEYANLADYRKRLETARADHEQLTGKVSEIEEEFGRDKERIQAEHEKQQSGRKEKLGNAETGLNDAFHTHEQNIKTVEIDLAKAVAHHKESRASERVNLSSEEARLKTLRDNPSQSVDERQQIADAEVTISADEEKIAALNSDRSTAHKKHGQAQTDLQQCQAQIETMDKTVERLENEFYALQRQIAPEDGTWLAQLKQQDPEWSNTIAKVIAPELLHRKDLSPEHTSVGELANTVMGWRLATEALSVPDFAASEDTLQERSRNLDEQRQAAMNQRTDIEREAKRQQDVCKSRADVVEQLEVSFRVAQRKLDQAKTNLSNTKTRVDNSVKSRIEKYDREYKEIGEQLQAFDEATEAGSKELESQYQQQLMDMRGHWSEKEADLQAAINKAKDMIVSAQTEHKERLKQKQQVYNQRLSEEGVDPNVVQKSRTALEELTEKVNAISASEDLVREYEIWRKREWVNIENLTAQANDAEASWNKRAQQRKTHEAEYKQKSEKLKHAVNEYRRAIGTLKEQIEAAESVLKHFSSDTTTEGFPGNLVDLTLELQSASQQLGQLRKEVISTFDRAAAILNQYHNTQIHKAWQKLSAYRREQFHDDMPEHEEPFKLARVPDLRELLDTDIPQLKAALVDQFMSESGSLVKYYEGLDVMAREVKSVSNLLKRKINTDQQIESLSDIRVVLHPRIYEDETWQPLKEFVDVWGDWSQLHRRELPNESVLRRFQVVTDTLSDARVRDSIESMIDLHLEMNENGRKVIIRNDADFLSASSTGLTYLAIMAVFMGMTRYLCPDFNTRITWPVDELGTLSDNNISRLAEMLEHHNLTMISACPKLDRALRRFFDNKISLNKGRIHSYQSGPTTTASHTGLFASLAEHAQTQVEGASDAQ